MPTWELVMMFRGRQALAKGPHPPPVEPVVVQAATVHGIVANSSTDDPKYFIFAFMVVSLMSYEKSITARPCLACKSRLNLCLLWASHSLSYPFFLPFPQLLSFREGFMFIFPSFPVTIAEIIYLSLNA